MIKPPSFFSSFTTRDSSLITHYSLLLVFFDVLLKLLSVGVVGACGEELFVGGGGLVLHARAVVEEREAQERFGLAEARGFLQGRDGLRAFPDLQVALAAH